MTTAPTVNAATLDQVVNDVYKVNVIHEPATARATPLSPRARRRERRRDEIVNAALALLGEEGLDGLTMARLAAELDLTPGALYRYFSGKDALVVEMQAVCLDVMMTRFEATTPSPPSNPIVAALAEILRVAWFYAELPREDPSAYRLISLTLANPDPVVADEAAVRVREPLERALTMVADRLVSAADVGALSAGDAISRSVLLWASVQGVVQTGKLDRLAPGFFAPILRVTQLLEALLLGWGAPAVHLTRALAAAPESPSP